MNAVGHREAPVLSSGKVARTLAMDQAGAGRRVATLGAGMIDGSSINLARALRARHSVGRQR